MLNDNDDIMKIKVDTKSNIHAFISPRVNLLEESTAEKDKQKIAEEENKGEEKPINIQDALNGQRGFDYFKINGYTVCRMSLTK